MCGLVGALGPIYAQEKRALENLLVMSSLRGVDSTGVLAVYADKGKWTYDISKRVGHVYNLLDSKKYDVLMSRTDKKVVLGHNRASTFGASTEANAHPFECEGLIGTHNGTLTHTSVRALEDHELYGTDSEALLNEIDKYGVKEAIGKVDGAWALVWWDMNLDQVNFLRNKERTLFYTLTEDKKNIFYASEPGFLHVALGRQGIKHKEVKLLPENTLFTWDIRTAYNDTYEIEPDAREHVEGKKSVVYVSPPSPTHNGGGNGAQGNFRRTYPHGGQQYSSNLNKDEPKKEEEAGKKDEEEKKGEVVTYPFRNGNQTHEQKTTGKGLSVSDARFIELHQTAESSLEGGDDLSDIGGDGGTPPNLLTTKPFAIAGYDGTTPMTENAYRNLTKEVCACCDTVVPYWSPDLIKEYGFDKKFISHEQVVCVECATNPDMEQTIRQIG